MSELTRTLAAQLHALAVTTRQRLETFRHDERGSVTIQEVLWAIAAIAFVGLVVAAVTTFLNGKIALIN